MPASAIGKNQKIHHYQVVGRKEPTAADPSPQLYRMQIFATNEVTARSRFWYFLHQYKKMKKTTGEILSVNEIFEKNKRIVNNYGIWLRYNSRSGTHNMYKEYRDTTLCGAVSQMYSEMAGRHSARAESIHIIKTVIQPNSSVVRPQIAQYTKTSLKFPKFTIAKRAPTAAHKNVFTASRPTLI